MNTANTVFLIVSAILVFFMTPGLAFFYGGLVSKKNVVNTMLSVFVICGLAIVLFVAFGYEMCFNGDIGGVVGHVRHFFLSGVDLNKIVLKDLGINSATYLVFEMMFAIITPALFVGATVGRMHFKFLLWFVVIWSILIYYPLVHMVWAAGGLMAKWGILDFAGGTVVHINAGITALVLSIFLGPRFNRNVKPYSIPWVLLGTAILWLGWYGFNAGSAFGMTDIAVNAFLTTTVSTAVSMVTWMLLETAVKSKPSLDGVCTGALCGLVGITPGTGYVTSVGAFFTAILCTLASFLFINYVKPRLAYDDPLDAFGCHGVSGIVGSLTVGLFATKSVNHSVALNGLFYGGEIKLFGIQLAGTLFTIAFTAVMASLIIVVLKRFVTMRVSARDEEVGLDLSEHGELADAYLSDSTPLSAK